MSNFASIDFASIEPQEFAQAVKSTPDSEISQALSGEERGRILDSIVGTFPRLFHADRAGSTNAVIHWNVTGRPDGGTDTYEVRIADGACSVTSTPEHEPRLSLTVGPLDFVKVVSGNGNPVMMVMTNKLKAKGDLSLATSIQQLFAIPKA